MPSKLTEPIEDTVKDFFIDNIRPGEVNGYDPDQTPSTSNVPDDFLLISTNWDDNGDYYPILIVTDQDNAPVIPNSGNTNYNGIQGDGSGPNQTYTQPVTVSAQAVEGRTYLNDATPKATAFTIAQECHSLIQNTVNGIDTEFLFNGATQPVHTPSNQEENGNSTDTWHQYQFTVDVGVIDTP